MSPLGATITPMRDNNIDHVPLSEHANNLGPAQHGEPIHEPEEPLPIRAWIENRKGHHLVDGWAHSWTPKAVRIRYIDEHGRQGWTWVWANAVERR